ncbi:MAG: hypothetical protein KDA75_20465, partial [Planctomycetaceae bacterium]|nr:hypothetical protein [Planctomycetaceae bacterium]
QDVRESGRMNAWFVPRGIGPTEWSRNEKERTHILRRFSLLGKTADELQTYDVVQAVRAIRGLPAATADLSQTPLTLAGEGVAAGWALYAAILEPNVQRLELTSLPATHDLAPIYLNVRRHLDVPAALALAAERMSMSLELPADDVGIADFAAAVAEKLGWGDEQVEVFTETVENVVVE